MSTADETNERVRSLDGLRGLAALQVLIGHVLVTNTDMDRAFLSTVRWETPENLPTWVWVMHRTPLALVQAQAEAVFLFFVLSGVVLCLQGPRPGPSWEVLTHWSRWLTARLARLYLPVWAAIGFAAALAALFGSGRLVGGGTMLDTITSRDFGVGAVFEDLVLFPEPGNTTVQLWTMRWEVLFSLCVPVVATVALRRPVLFWVGVVVFGPVAIVAGPDRLGGHAHYLAMFMAGSAVAYGVLGPRGTGLSRVPVWWLWLSVALAMFMSRWITASGTPFDFVPLDVAVLVSVLGACGLIVLAVRAAPVRGFLETRPLQWLGSRSFALYLVHLPVVVASLSVTGGWTPMCSFVSVVVSLMAAEVFARLVERPALAISRRMRR